MKVLFASILFLVSMQANAALITQTQSFNLQKEAWGDNVFNLSGWPADVAWISGEDTVDMSFNLFDSTLGTLDFVAISINGAIEWDADYSSISTVAPKSINAGVWGGYAYQSTDTPLLQSISAGNGDNATLTSFNGSIDGTAQSLVVQGYNVGPDGLCLGSITPITLLGSCGITGSLEINPFIGTGFFNLPVILNVDLFGISTDIGTSTTFEGGTVQATFIGEVSTIYGYSPVSVSAPEPTTLALMSLGLIGLVSARRKGIK